MKKQTVKAGRTATNRKTCKKDVSWKHRILWYVGTVLLVVGIVGIDVVLSVLVYKVISGAL